MTHRKQPKIKKWW